MKELDRIRKLPQDKQGQQIENIKIVFQAHIDIALENRRKGQSGSVSNRNLIKKDVFGD